MKQVGSMPLRVQAWRARLVLALLLLWLLALLGRAAFLQGWNNEFLRQKGDARYSRVIEISATRGMITDRWGEPLAISTPVESVCAIADEVEMAPAMRAKLARALDMDEKELHQKLAKRQGFVYLKRQLPPEVAAGVMSLKIPGVFLQREYRRYYPAGEVMAHVLGFTGADDIGQEGVELAYQDWLVGTPGSKRVIKDNHGDIIEDVESIKAPHQGHDLELSIDRKIQYLAYRELKTAVEQNRAKAGSIVVLDAKTGEVLAMANQPSYNPNNRIDLTGSKTRNRAITDLYEPGSTMKPFAVGTALEIGLVTPDTVIQTAPGTLQIGPATIHDAEREGALTVTQVIQKSSNVGVSKIILQIKPEVYWNYLRASGFGSTPGLNFPGEATGKVRPYKTWRPIEEATMAFGHGISVSLLQMARAYMVFTNNGEIKPVTLVKDRAAVPGKRVFSAEVANEVKSMLEKVVLPGGTALRAQVPSYRVAGKTGTAHKVDPSGGYSKDKYIASFIGFAPASNPRLIVAVMIDEPSAGQYYGGQVAAPVFSRVMGSALRMMGVPPDAPVNNVVLPSDGAVEVPESF